jgi:predicted DNA-binding ribbon-helix-helix protein
MARNLVQLGIARFENSPGEYRSTLVNRNVTVSGHRTSIRLEPVMWDALRQICEREQQPLNAVVTEIATMRAESSLTAAIRVYLLSYFQTAATEEGHRRAGHGGTRMARLSLTLR